MMRKITKNLHLALTALFITLFVSTKLYSNNDIVESENLLTDSFAEKVSSKDIIKQELITEVETYVFSNFPKTTTTKALKKIPTLIVEKGLEHKIDIMFIMAQTQIETHYGTAGAGRETARRSLFGVAAKKYNTYESAVTDYIRILRKSYLTKGRTEQHLMRKYTTSGGARYAGNPNYEVELRNTYSDIKKKTKIFLLQNKYKNFSES